MVIVRIAAVPPIKILQYEICPFCNKLKAILDYYKVPYTTVSECERVRVRWRMSYVNE